jgi:hypothetical protein
MALDYAETAPLVLHPRQRLVEQIRDGVMQDLVAVGMLVTSLRSRLAIEQVDASADDVLIDITATLNGDVEHLRAVLQELDAA